jgi:hypothetical protein
MDRHRIAIEFRLGNARMVMPIKSGLSETYTNMTLYLAEHWTMDMISETYCTLNTRSVLKFYPTLTLKQSRVHSDMTPHV